VWPQTYSTRTVRFTDLMSSGFFAQSAITHLHSTCSWQDSVPVAYSA